MSGETTAKDVLHARTSEELHSALQAGIKEGQPTFFEMSAQLPLQGRTNTPLASTDLLWAVLKTYAGTGENGLHAHPYEDHVFVVLQGAARFDGPNGEYKVVGLHGGVMLPHNTYYSFKALGDEPLVMLRVACALGPDVPRHGRVDISGQPMPGSSKENKEVDLVLGPDWFG